MCMISGVMDYRKDRPPSSSITFESLQDYQKLAVRLVKAVLCKKPDLRRWILRDDDAMADVAQGLMTADWTYDAECGTQLATHRVNWVKWRLGKILPLKVEDQERTVNFDPYDLDKSMHLQAGRSPKEMKATKARFGDLDSRNMIVDQLLRNIDSPNKAELADLLSRTPLTEKQLEVIQLKYVAGLENVEISVIIGCSRERVRQHIENAIKRIRESNGIKTKTRTANIHPPVHNEQHDCDDARTVGV